MTFEAYFRWLLAATGLSLAFAVAAQPAPPAPPFDVAYRAWNVVTELARHHKDPRISGECGTSFRPFVIAGLRRQTRQEEDIAATACVAAARAACGNRSLQRPASVEKDCAEFR